MNDNFLQWYLVVNESYLLTKKGLNDIYYLLSHGITCCQLRIKTLSYEKAKIYAIKLKKWCAQFNVVFIINDNLKLAKDVDADGIHIGWSDVSAKICKKAFPSKIIGMSVSNKQEISKVHKFKPNYLGVGAIYPTNSKADAQIFSDFNALNSIEIPFIFIGGLTANNILKLKKYHPAGFAFISFLLNNPKNIHNLVN